MENKLYNIIEDLNKYKRNKEDLLPEYINKRLNKSLAVYYKQLMNSFDFLKYKNSETVIKNMNRY